MKDIITQQEVNFGIDPKDYTIVEKIGEGGYGKVYKAQKTSTGMDVAIKILKFKESPDEQSRKQQIARFERETQLCAEINHPNIVKLLDKDYTSNNEPFAVFEFISGETLKDLISKNNGLPAEETGKLMEQVLDALICAHGKGIIHRDLKPHNIMVTKTETRSYVKILDFGMGAFTYDFRASDYKNLTMTQEVIGTPAYSAPEQLRGDPPTVKTDLYAWGLIFLECLTGQPVMQGTSVAEIFQKQLNPADVPIPPSIIEHPIAKVLTDALRKDPYQRTPSASLIFEEFSKVNLNTIVGDIKPQNTVPSPAEDVTAVNQFAWRSAHTEKRLLTVLCAKLSLSMSDDAMMDIETLETIQKDQLNLCKDTGVRFGAHVSGIMADTIIMYFGYPQGSDTDARRAGRTALELITKLQKRSALLSAKHRIGLDIRVAINSGTALIKHKTAPEGLVTNTAFNLLYTAQPGHIIVSETSKKLLDPYLEFEPFQGQQGFSGSGNVATYLLTGERSTEALSHLSLRSADQKMIGREVEQKQIAGIWESIQSSNGQAILVRGQAGIGKSKLIYESKKQVLTDGFIVRECYCLPEYQNNALHPIFEMIKKDLGMHDTASMIPSLERGLKKLNCDLQKTIPVFCSWFSIPLSDGYEVSEDTPAEQREILFSTLKKMILTLDTEKKFMLIIEDLHWIDPTSLEFINQLLGSLAQENYLLLLTSRPEFESNWTQEQITTIELYTLKETFAHELIKNILGQKEVDTEVLTYIVERADGIPLFIEDLTQMLLEQRQLILDQDMYRLTDKFDKASVPVTLKGLLNARLDRLGFAKETAQLAAAIGREFSYELLIKSSLHDEAMVQADLNALLEANLIYRHRRVHNEMYIFRHALIKDAAYEGMLANRRKEAHGRIADTIETSLPEVVNENPFELARHLAISEQHQKASKLGLEAIRKHIKNSANEEALRLHQIITDWVANIKDEIPRLKGELKANIVVSAAAALKEGWGSQNQFEMAKRNTELIAAIKVADGYTPDPEINDFEIKNDWALFSFYHAQSKSQEAKEIGEELIKKSIANGNHKVEMAISSFLGQSYFISGNIDKSESLLETVIEKFDLKEDKAICLEYGFDPYIFATGLLGFIYCFRGYPDKAMQSYKNGIEYSKTTENDSLVVTAYVFMVCFLSIIDNKELSKKYVDKIHTLLGDRLKQVWVSCLLDILVDWVDNKSDIAEKQREAIINAGQSLALSYYEPSMTKTYITLQQYDKAIALLKDSIERQVKHHEKSILPLFYNLLGTALLKKENRITPEIEDAFEESIKHSESMKFTLLKLFTILEYSEFLIKESNIEKAKSLLDSVKEFSETMTEIKDLEAYQKYIHLYMQIQ